MGIYDSSLWISDLDEIVRSLPELKGLSGKSVLVTGAGGLICSAFVDVLIRWNALHEEKIHIVAAARDERKVKERFGPYAREPWFSFIFYDAASNANVFVKPCEYLIHGASNASPNRIVEQPVETMLSNVTGMKELLDYAKDAGSKRVLFVSSSEVYGKKEGNHPFRNDEYGSIDLLNARNSYAIGKCAAETLCVSYAAEYGVDCVIVRPGHIYGPTAGVRDNRVSSAWAYSAARGEDIVMKSDGSQLRSYCYCLDCASAMLKVLLKGEASHAYNISNPDSIISIRMMAEILAKHGNINLRMELPTEKEKKGFNPMQNSSLDSRELESLGWRGLFSSERGLSHTVDILKTQINGQAGK